MKFLKTINELKSKTYFSAYKKDIDQLLDLKKKYKLSKKPSRDRTEKFLLNAKKSFYKELSNLKTKGYIESIADEKFNYKYINDYVKNKLKSIGFRRSGSAQLGLPSGFFLEKTHLDFIICLYEIEDAYYLLSIRDESYIRKKYIIEDDYLIPVMYELFA